MPDEMTMPFPTRALSAKEQELLDREWTLTPEQEALAADLNAGRVTGDAEPGSFPKPPV